MDKRQLILNNYKTAEDGLWTLASCKITKAAQVQNFVSVPGRFAPLDLSTVLTDGQPYYGSASLSATLESSEGTREERQQRIEQMVNLLDGYTMQIIHPDHPDRYLVGRAQVTPDYNNLVQARVQVTAVCEPWLYNAAETVKRVTLPQEQELANLANIPDTTLKGQAAYASQLLGDFELAPGEYTLSLKYKHTGDLRGSLSVREYGKLDGYIKDLPLFANRNSEAAVTFTVPEGAEGIRLYLYSNVTATPGGTSVTISDVMVNEGPTALPYEPWHPSGSYLLALTNDGRLAMVPKVDVYGEATLTYGDITQTLSTGTYYLPDIFLKPGEEYVVLSGSGTVSFTYREAVLAE